MSKIHVLLLSVVLIYTSYISFTEARGVAVYGGLNRGQNVRYVKSSSNTNSLSNHSNMLAILCLTIAFIENIFI